MAYNGAVAMDIPRLPRGPKAPAWWKALLVTAFNTQLRRRTLFEMRWDEVDFAHCRLNLPPARFKSHRRQTIHLNPVTVEHLKRIHTDASQELVFPWPHEAKYFHVVFHRLQTAAAIPRKEHFGLHDLRKTAASILWEDSPQVAQYSLGHASMSTTLKHYVNLESRGGGVSIVARALDALPQPAEFMG
jgi:integrase